MMSSSAGNAETTKGQEASFCPVCGGSGFELDTALRRARPCLHCRPQGTALVGSSGIPPHYLACTLENFKVHFQGAPSSSLVHAVLVCRSYVRDYPATQPPGLLLTGPCGVGKTHLATAVLRELIAVKRVSGRFFDSAMLINILQEKQRHGSPAEVRAIWTELEACDVLVLDDLGAGCLSEWALDLLTHVVTVRYNTGRALIATTLYGDGGGEQDLEKRLGPRVRSRLAEMCALVRLEGADYRRRMSRLRTWGRRDEA